MRTRLNQARGERRDRNAPMVEAVSLDDIALGVTGSAEARKAISAATERVTAAIAARLYTVLRAWTWKALNERRRDEDLREWHDVLRASVALLRDGYPALAERIETLSELIYESVAVSTMFAVAKPLKRHQVREILRVIHETGGVTFPKLQAAMGMERGDLLGLINLLLNCDLVRRVWTAAEPSYELASPNVWPAAKILIPVSTKASANKVKQIVKISYLPSHHMTPSHIMPLIEKKSSHYETLTPVETPTPTRLSGTRRDNANV